MAATLTGPALAAGLVWLGWSRTDRDAKSRDEDNWRRTTLANAVTDLISVAEDLVAEPTSIKNVQQVRDHSSKRAVLGQKVLMIDMCGSAEMALLAKRYEMSIIVYSNWSNKAFAGGTADLDLLAEAGYQGKLAEHGNQVVYYREKLAQELKNDVMPRRSRLSAAERASANPEEKRP
ncbi:hypothetical protein [Rhodococcoides kroppenstedtii]|uniref:hypothetical protein n=1 Tax=Rhodococcoides kroppenstedtii TaxID=293050 RepID=UPI0011134A4D|nr:hypothetical protein [Rhodococcus kroppenstedtii]MBT1192888.1 hypothetical protein [Rhodococcus kroppenstedtii]